MPLWNISYEDGDVEIVETWMPSEDIWATYQDTSYCLLHAHVLALLFFVGGGEGIWLIADVHVKIILLKQMLISPETCQEGVNHENTL